jgi:hypothetical protein
MTQNDATDPIPYVVKSLSVREPGEPDDPTARVTHQLGPEVSAAKCD